MKSSYQVGVIGGGQLARMMIPAALALGFEIRVLAETEDSSAKQAAVVGDYTNLETVIEFAKTVDVITFDHEHVPIHILEALENQGVSVQPPSKALVHAQNKLTMRRALAEIGAPNPLWRAVSSASELDLFISQHGPEVVVKTPIGGYDGKGVRVVNSSSQASDWLAQDELARLGGELLVEQKVDFKRELAQLSARNPSGEFKAWVVVETRQKNGVCSEVIAPAPNMTESKKTEAVEIARNISEKLEVTGNLAVEMFETAAGELLVNELAMRPHNSGHFSIEGSKTSQFEQHLRAVLDLPLGSTSLNGNVAVMANLLGTSNEIDFLANYPKVMANYPDIKFHSYGKGPRVGRKLGHLTLIADDTEAALARVKQARQELLSLG